MSRLDIAPDLAPDLLRHDGCEAGLLADLLLRCGRGDEAAFALLLDTFYPVVVAAANAAEVAPEETERVIASAFLAIWREAPLYRSTEASAVSWTMHRVLAATSNDDQYTLRALNGSSPLVQA